jgi:hypothetical protein
LLRLLHGRIASATAIAASSIVSTHDIILRVAIIWWKELARLSFTEVNRAREGREGDFGAATALVERDNEAPAELEEAGVQVAHLGRRVMEGAVVGVLQAIGPVPEADAGESSTGGAGGGDIGAGWVGAALKGKMLALHKGREVSDDTHLLSGVGEKGRGGNRRLIRAGLAATAGVRLLILTKEGELAGGEVQASGLSLICLNTMLAQGERPAQREHAERAGTERSPCRAGGTSRCTARLSDGEQRW